MRSRERGQTLSDSPSHGTLDGRWGGGVGDSQELQQPMSPEVVFLRAEQE